MTSTASVPNKPDAALAKTHAENGTQAFAAGDVQGAIAAFRAALDVLPQDPNLLSSLGFCLYKNKEFDEANRLLSRSVSLDPAHAVGWQNLGLLRRDTGDMAMACEAFARAVAIDRTNTIYMRLFMDVFSTIQLSTHHDWIKNVLIFCLKRDNIELRELNKAWAWFYQIDPAFAALNAWAHDTNDTQYPTALDDPYLNLGLQKIRISSMEFERLMTATRRKILEKSAVLDIGQYHDFLFSLGMQGWLNEHVYYIAPDEETMLAGLRAELEKNVVHDTHYIARLYLYATYETLEHLVNAQDIYDALFGQGDAQLDRLLTLHIAHPATERAIRPTIPVLGSIQDTISLQVRDQYEDHPYPRWSQFFSDDKPVDHVKSVLIAGCGTGQQTGLAAQMYPQAQIDNIDLSLTSLAYAIRKTREMGLQNLSFAQADLLEVAALNKSYDVIECIGVLHHMKDPQAGLKALSACLKPGGTIKLGLYSEAARQDIAAVRDFITAGQYGSGTRDIRALRQIIADHPDAAISDCSIRYDFFTTSSCRDLIMHVQEHRFTIPKIRALLDACGLSFLEFSLHRRILNEVFRKEFPDPAAFYDLACWEKLEALHPTFFSGMYIFSACHKADHEQLRKKP